MDEFQSPKRTVDKEELLPVQLIHLRAIDPVLNPITQAPN